MRSSLALVTLASSAILLASACSSSSGGGAQGAGDDGGSGAADGAGGGSEATSVTVPAGTYTDCWTANQNVSYTAYITYCRGVGMVRSYSSDLTGAGWDAKLASKSF